MATAKEKMPLVARLVKPRPEAMAKAQQEGLAIEGRLELMHAEIIELGVLLQALVLFVSTGEEERMARMIDLAEAQLELSASRRRGN